MFVSVTALAAMLGSCARHDHAVSSRDDVDSLAQGWAYAYYQLPDAQKDVALIALQGRARELAHRGKPRADALVWEAIITASRVPYEEVGEGDLAWRHARELLLSAEQLDPHAMDGLVYASLGRLYDEVPGWPLSFGNKKTARTYLERALQIDPHSIDANFYYGALLAEQGDDRHARSYLNRALAAPPRAGHADADQGRRDEISELLAELDD